MTMLAEHPDMAGYARIPIICSGKSKTYSAGMWRLSQWIDREEFAGFEYWDGRLSCEFLRYEFLPGCYSDNMYAGGSGRKPIRPDWVVVKLKEEGSHGTD